MSEEKIHRILFVCLGNICRSPAAEALMKAVVSREGREEGYRIDSAGLYSGHSGSLPDERMREHAARRGYVLDSRARAFYPAADFADFDLIVGMDNRNIRQLNQLALNGEERARICRMTDFCRRIKGCTEVPDPYYEGPDGFELVLDLLEDAVEGLFDYCEHGKSSGRKNPT